MRAIHTDGWRATVFGRITVAGRKPLAWHANTVVARNDTPAANRSRHLRLDLVHLV